MLSFGAPFNTKISLVSSIRAKRNMYRDGQCASQILPRLYLSDLSTVSDGETLDLLGITHILSVLDFSLENIPPKYTRLHIPLPDLFTTDILSQLPRTTEFIRNALDEGPNTKVLVHCMMGISRSATVVCAYLIATLGMTAKEAITFTKSQRSVIRPNNGFVRQLNEYEKQLKQDGNLDLVSTSSTSKTRSALQERLRNILGGTLNTSAITHNKPLLDERTLSTTIHS